MSNNSRRLKLLEYTAQEVELADVGQRPQQPETGRHADAFGLPSSQNQLLELPALWGGRVAVERRQLLVGGGVGRLVGVADVREGRGVVQHVLLPLDKQLKKGASTLGPAYLQVSKQFSELVIGKGSELSLVLQEEGAEGGLDPGRLKFADLADQEEAREDLAVGGEVERHLGQADQLQELLFDQTLLLEKALKVSREKEQRLEPVGTALVQRHRPLEQSLLALGAAELQQTELEEQVLEEGEFSDPSNYGGGPAELRPELGPLLGGEGLPAVVGLEQTLVKVVGLVLLAETTPEAETKGPDDPPGDLHQDSSHQSFLLLLFLLGPHPRLPVGHPHPHLLGPAHQLRPGLGGEVVSQLGREGPVVHQQHLQVPFVVHQELFVADRQLELGLEVGAVAALGHGLVAPEAPPYPAVDTPGPPPAGGQSPVVVLELKPGEVLHSLLHYLLGRQGP